MTFREYVAAARHAVTAQRALNTNSEAESAAWKAAGNRGLLPESAEYLRLNQAADEAVRALPVGLRSLTALDLFAGVDGLLRGARQRMRRT